MAISTLDGALAGMQAPIQFYKTAPGVGRSGLPQTHWASAGFPAAGAYDTTLNGVVLDSTNSGAISFGNPLSGSNTYVNLLEILHSVNGGVILADRLWHNGGITITSTSAQSITSPTFPARDNNASTNGVGVMLGVEVSGSTSSGSPTITIGYTNSSGTSGRTATNYDATIPSTAISTFHRMRLQTGDVGVRSVQSITLSSSWTSGTINIVAYRPLMFVSNLASIGEARDALTGGFPRVMDSSCLFFIGMPASSGSNQIGGMIGLTQG